MTEKIVMLSKKDKTKRYIKWVVDYLDSKAHLDKQGYGLLDDGRDLLEND